MEAAFRPKSLERAKEHKDSQESKILNASQHQFAVKGFKGTTTRDIAEEAGVNIATLHYFWGSKEELWNAAHYAIFQELQQFNIKLIAEVSKMKPREALRTAVFKYYSLMVTRPELTLLREKAHGMDIEKTWEKEEKRNFELVLDFLEKHTKYDFDPVNARFALGCFFGAVGYFLQPWVLESTFEVVPPEIPEEFRWKVTDAVCTMLDRFGQVDRPPAAPLTI